MSNKVVKFLEWIGTEFEKGVTLFEKYEPEVAGIAGLIFPPAKAALAGASAAVHLVQNTVVSIEQKYAASGKQNGTGTQKLAEVVSITTPAVLQLLSADGIQADASTVEDVANVVVAVLNAKAAPTS